MKLTLTWQAQIRNSSSTDLVGRSFNNDPFSDAQVRGSTPSAPPESPEANLHEIANELTAVFQSFDFSTVFAVLQEQDGDREKAIDRLLQLGD